MPKSQSLERILDRAKKKEKMYDWAKAVDLYEQALGAVGKRDFLRKGEIQEKISYCVYSSAFQAETQEEFKGRIQQAVAGYEKASKIYGKVGHAERLYCEAMALYANSWVQPDAARKKDVLDDCARLLKEAMKAFRKAGKRLGYGRACNDLLFCRWDRIFLEWDWREKTRILEEAIKYGQEAISTLSKIGDKRELARAYSIAGLHTFWAVDNLGEEKSKELTQKALTYAETALELSKRTGEASLIAWSNWLATWAHTDLTGNQESALRHSEESLRQAKKTGDNFLIGYALLAVGTMVVSLTIAEENPDKKKEGCESTVQYAEDAVHHLRIVCRYDWLPEAYSYHSLGLDLAHRLETDLKERRNLLERAIEVGQEGLKLAEQTGSPQMRFVHNRLGLILYSLARMEIQMVEKRRLLEKASEHIQKSIDMVKQAQSPSNYWDHGFPENHLSLIKAEMATIEIDKEKKRNLLEEAVSHMEDCVELCARYLTIFAPKDMILLALLGSIYDRFSDILNRLYALTRKKETLMRALEICETAADIYRRAELPSRVAETYWQAARLYYQLGEYTKAEHSFQSAEENYRLAAEKIPQLKVFYEDHALYMQAWSEIERARYLHAQRKYGQAKEHYERAANLHKTTKSWNYLSLNYSAWARLEEAEDLSRRDQTEEAKGFFRQAASLFAESKKAIQTNSEKVEIKDEQEILFNVAKASDIRHEYCLGRIALEEAKILDRQGDHAASSRKYGAAAKKFQQATNSMEHESERKELRPIVCLSRAWEVMTRAEAEALPDLFSEASKLFDEAKEHSFDEKAKILASGHSHFCKALEAGTRFEDTGDIAMYSTAKKHLEASAKYYLKADIRNASEYARATHRLFDAYMYMHKAEMEVEPKRKAQYYRMAEKMLQASAGSFMKAKHPEKSGEVKRLLESVREERQLAVSLIEAIHAPTITSTTTSFAMPAKTPEQALGLERFEHANIQASLLLRVKEARIGDDVDFRLDLVNAGKAPALLIRVEELIPEGFEITEIPTIYRVEDSYLNLKGKRLDPLKTEEIRIVAKPRSKGRFIMKPRILYIDETGKHKLHEPEPVTITVKELGIKGWIKGER